MVPCMAAVKAIEEPEKISDRRSTALPGEGVTRGVLDEVLEPVGVGVAVSVVVEVREIVGVWDGVIVGEAVRVVVVDGVAVRVVVVDGVRVFDGDDVSEVM